MGCSDATIRPNIRIINSANVRDKISLRKQEDAIRDLASRAEVRAEQSIRKIAGYFQQKVTELHALNRSMEENRNSRNS